MTKLLTIEEVMQRIHARAINNFTSQIEPETLATRVLFLLEFLTTRSGETNAQIT